jgi:hypothetical protein
VAPRGAPSPRTSEGGQFRQTSDDHRREKEKVWLKLTAVIPGRDEVANPESILPVVVMDSGFARFANAPE